MMLTLSKRIIESDRALRREPNVNRNELVGNEIEHKTVGIIGLGNVGRRIAALCNGLLGMKVLAYDPYLSAEVMAERGGEKVELDELLRRADFVSISCPLDKRSRNMISAREFALMQPHAYLHHHRARLHSRRGCAAPGAARQAHRRRRPRRLGQGAAAAGASAAAVRQRAGEPAHRRRHASRRARTWAASPPSRCSRRSTASGRRASSIPRSGRFMPSASSRPLA